VHTDLLEETAASAALIRCLQHELEPNAPGFSPGVPASTIGLIQLL
jgi:hypothetical protein